MQDFSISLLPGMASQFEQAYTALRLRWEAAVQTGNRPGVDPGLIKPDLHNLESLVKKHHTQLRRQNEVQGLPTYLGKREALKPQPISFEANQPLIRTVLFHWILAVVTPPHCSTEIRPLSSDFQPSSHAPNAQKPSRQTSPDLPASSPSHITSVPFPGVTGKFSCSLRPVLGENRKHQEAAL